MNSKSRLSKPKTTKARPASFDASWAKAFGKRKRDNLGLSRPPRAQKRREPPKSSPFVAHATEGARVAERERARVEPAPRKIRWSRKTVQRRAARLRWYFIILLALIVGGVAGVEIYQYRAARMWGSELFLLEEIVVEGNDRVSTDEITESLDLTLHTTTMQQVVPAGLESRLRAAFVDIREVSVVREMPGRVRVRVVEREPLARVRVGGETLVIDEEGVALARPFKQSVSSAQTKARATANASASSQTRASKQDIARQTAALPLIVAQVSRDASAGVVSGDGLSSALRLLAHNREQSVSKARPASLANLVRPMPPIDPAAPPPPKPKTPPRVLRVSELEDRPLEVESIDAKDARKIVVRFRPHQRRGVTVWFSENYLADGLSNFYRAYAYRLLTVPMEYDSPVVASASAAPLNGSGQTLSSSSSSPMIENRESSRELTQSGASPEVASQESSSGTPAVASSTLGSASHLTHERYDARFESTLYITSTGGQNG